MIDQNKHPDDVSSITFTNSDLHSSNARMREMTSRIIANHSGQSFDQVEKDVERDRILSPPQAKEYGLIDEVIEHRDK